MNFLKLEREYGSYQKKISQPSPSKVSKDGIGQSGRPASFTDSSPFRLANHWLEGKEVNYLETSNKGGIIQPSYLVFHYTAGRSAQSSIACLTNPLAKASAYLGVGRDGPITQLAPFTTKTWHAGVSHWDDLTGLNQHSIGIEMDNAGTLIAVVTKLTAWFGKSYPKSQAIFATHKLDTEPSGGMPFPRNKFSLRWN